MQKIIDLPSFKVYNFLRRISHSLLPISEDLMEKRVLMSLRGAFRMMLASLICAACGQGYFLSFNEAFGVSAAYADAQGGRSPYGGSESGAYGEKREVKTTEEARKALREYFSKKDVRVGEIKEKDLYFEAEIRDKNDNLVDKVIIDKRTGRIRSIF